MGADCSFMRQLIHFIGHVTIQQDLLHSEFRHLLGAVPEVLVRMKGYRIRG